MNSAYAPNSQPNVPTRVCQGRVVTTDLPTLGTNPNTKQHRSATQEAKNLGDLHSLGRTVRVGGGIVRGGMRTVRKHRAGHPKMAPKLPVLHLKKRTIRPQPADRPCCADCPASPCGLSAKPCATKSTPPNGLKRRTRTHEELDELLVESLLVDRPPRESGPSAWSADSSSSPTS
jgi:hypothetical protein